MTREEFATHFAALTQVFRTKPTDLAIEAYYAVVQHLAADEWRSACLKLLGKSKFMPAPAELLEAAGLGDNTERKAAEAWEAVRGAIRRHDSYASVDFGPLVNAVVRNMGGWIRLCDMTRDEATWKRKEFERVYGLFAAQPVASLDGRALAGEHDAPPVRIAIGGVAPAPMRALPEKTNGSSNGVRDVVAKLAEGKTLTPPNGANR